MNPVPKKSGNSAAQVLEAVIAAHENYVLRRPNGKRGDLRFAKSAGVNLDGRRLDEIEFSGAELKGASFEGTNLRSASLYCADLTEANLANANLTQADMRGSRVNGANFENAQLDRADFRQATIARMDAKTGWTIIGGKQNLASVSFANCSLRGAKLNHANLKDANFNGAILNGASFKGTNLGNSTFEGAVLIGVDLAELQIPKDRLKHCVTDPSPQSQQDLARFIAILDKAELFSLSGGQKGAAANLEGEDIRLLAALMKNRKLTAMNCARTIAVGADLSGCELQVANFDGADLRGASFAGADLRGASFRGANLSHADFRGANLMSLALVSGDIMPTKFEGAIMSRCNFDGALRSDPPQDPAADATS